MLYRHAPVVVQNLALDKADAELQPRQLAYDGNQRKVVEMLFLPTAVVVALIQFVDIGAQIRLYELFHPQGAGNVHVQQKVAIFINFLMQNLSLVPLAPEHEPTHRVYLNIRLNGDQIVEQI